MLNEPEFIASPSPAVITRLLRSRRTLSDLQEPRPYLMRAVLNESLNHLKRSDGTTELGELLIEPHRSDPDVLAAVVALPRQQRAAVRGDDVSFA